MRGLLAAWLLQAGWAAPVQAAPPVAPSAPVASTSPSLPRSADLMYDVIWGPLTIEAEQHWRLEGKRYSLSTELKLPLAFKNRRYVSTGTLSDDGLVPDLYQDLEVGDPKPRNIARFERSTGQLVYGRPDKPRTVKLEAQTQDINALSFQLSFLGLQAVGKAMPVTNGKSVVQHRFAQVAGGPVQFNGQALETVRLRSSANDGEIEVWLAPNLGNLPITVVRSQDGKSLKFVATSVNFKP